METKEKRNVMESEISIVKVIFGIFIFLILLYMLVSGIVLPDERDASAINCRVFESEWEQVLENGDRVPVEVPGKVKAEYGEVVTLITTLPQEINSGECLCFRPIWQDIDIFIDGEKRLSYSTKKTRPFGTNSAMRYLFVELSESDEGKELMYQFSSNSKYAGNMQKVRIGDRASIWFQFVNETGMKTVISILLIMLSIFCIITCVILKFVYKRTLNLIYLAWVIFFCAFWMLSESDFRQLLFENISALSNLTYWSLMLLPFALIVYINDVQKGYYKKIYFFPLIYAVVMTVTGTILQVLDIAQFVQQIPFIHAGLIVAMICIITTITIDVFKRRVSNYLFVGIGIYGMLLTAILEMVLYYAGASVSLGTVLGIGLMFLLIMAVIKTGQDLFSTEKKKQQAITAREAQAKFLANMSHEIRTPINAIVGMNEMILRENEDKAIENYAHNIQSASDMLLGLINDVLDFSKIESGQLELVEDEYQLSQLIQDELLILNTRASEKPISTRLEMDYNLPSVLWGDELRIKQVLTNLLSNAVKYTKEGSVTIKAFFNKLDEENIELCFSVIDTGIGIRQEDLSKLFDSFKRLELDKNRNVQGTGLGLNITKQLVELMQGTIVVDSEYGKGSAFTIKIPQKVVDVRPIGSLEKSVQESRKKTQTTDNLFTAPEASVLIVDDNAMNRSLMKGLLKRTQIQVVVAASGKECLELTSSQKFDIIFMDHMMPELDGVETLRILREQPHNLNKDGIVIALTANAIAGCREMYLQYGFDDYFAKPIKADKMDELLLQYLPKELVRKKKVPETEENTGVSTVVKKHEQTSDIAYIDKEKGMEYCLNSEELYREVLSEFCVQSKEYVGQLEKHFNNHDWKQYTIIAHALKSSAMNIGALAFSKVSLQHELAGSEENEAFLATEYANYISALKALIKNIEEMYQE